MGDYRLIAGATAAGAALIAAGVYWGRTDVLPDAVPVPSRVAPSSRPAPVAAATPVDPDEALQARAIAEATRAVETQKPELLKKCWAPALAKAPDPPSAPYFLGLSIDAQGKLTGTMVVMPRVGSRTDVWTCLRTVPLSLSITPPGKPIHLDIPLNFP